MEKSISSLGIKMSSENQLFSEIYTKNQLFCEFSLLKTSMFGNRCVTSRLALPVHLRNHSSPLQNNFLYVNISMKLQKDYLWLRINFNIFGHFGTIAWNVLYSHQFMQASRSVTKRKVYKYQHEHRRYHFGIQPTLLSTSTFLNASEKCH